MDSQKQAIEKDIDAYKALAKLNQSDELNAFIELLMKTATSKLMDLVTNKDMTYEKFLETRAEITSYLYPIQEVRGAKAMSDRLTEQLNEWYKVDN